jgi:hypothetical protein
MPHPDARIMRTMALASLPDTAYGPVTGAIPTADYLEQPYGWEATIITFEQTTVADGTGTRLAAATTTADVTVYYWYTADNARTPITGQTIVTGHPIRNGLVALVPPGARYSVVLSALTSAPGSALGLNVYGQPAHQ